MDLPTRHLSVKWKIGGSLALVVLVIDIFQLWYFPARQISQLQSALEHKVRSLGRFVAYEVQVGLEFDDKKSVETVFRGLKRDQDFLAAALFDKDRKLFAAHGEGPASVRVTIGRKMAIDRPGDRLRVQVPVENKGRVLGALVMDFSTKGLAKERQDVRRATYLTGTLILGLGLLVAVALGGSIGKRLGALEVVARQVADGNLAAEIPAGDARDEIGRMTTSFREMLDAFREMQAFAEQVSAGDLTKTTSQRGELAEAFNRMVAAQREMVSRFAETAVQLNTAATELRASAEQQNRGAVEQSSAVEENQRTMDTLLKSAGHIADTAKLVLQNAETTQENSRLVADRIATLTTHTARIFEILQGINEIANKSDLLALNAALEGTKAGEAGRGFSLVANQMQRLAENVMSSVVDIKRLTTTIKEATRETVLATEETNKIAANNTRSARQIAMTIQQQQTGTEQVTRTMEDVARIARDAAAGSNQVYSSADDLVSVSGRLQDLVNRFTVSAGRAGTLGRSDPGRSDPGRSGPGAPPPSHDDSSSQETSHG